MKEINYYAKLNDELTSYLSNCVSLTTFEELLNDDKIHLTNSTNSLLNSYIKDINYLFDVILSIASSPHYLNSPETLLIRSEQSYQIDNEDYINTLRDSSLWKRKGQNLAPEYVYSKSSKEDIITYENKFVIYVFNLLMQEINKFYKDNPLGNSLENLYKQEQITFSENSLVNDITENNKNISALLSDDNQDNQLINKVYAKGKRIEQTSFYKLLSKETISLPIIPTNILLHDQKYYYLYRFYRTNLKRNNDDSMFVNYVTLKILETLIENKYRFNKTSSLTFSDNQIQITDLICSKDGFTYKFNKDDNYLYLDVKTGTSYSKNLIIIKEELDEAIFEEFDNVFYICQINKSKQNKNVLEIDVLSKKDSRVSLDDIFLSLRLTVKGSLSKKCPICGKLSLKEDKRFDQGNFFCPNCNSSLALINKGQAKLIWLKSLWGGLYGK